RDNHRNWLYFGILPPAEKTFGHLMQERGYKTCMAGKWQLQSYDPPDFPNAALRRGVGMHPEAAGFDRYSVFHALHTEDKGSRYANPTFLQDGALHREVAGEYGEDLAVDYLLDFMKKHRADPMFVYYPMALPHWPMVPTPRSEAWKDPSLRLEEDVKYFPDMVAYMDELVGRLVSGIEELGLREDTLILFYSDNGTDRRIQSRFDGGVVQGGKNTTAQSGIRVPLIAHWPGTIPASVSRDLVESSDFLPTLADLSGNPLPSDWPTDGVSFAPLLLGQENEMPREWAFFWYDPRPGWDKDQFSRSIFALNHDYKYFSDGRLFDIAGNTLREKTLDPNALTPEARQARDQLQGVIDRMMRPPVSPAAQIEVDAFGVPVGSRSK
ncbi:MAG: sulfatase-like hydrolase/transferase, partial [Verrucomicrobiota bacterium]